MDIREHRGFGHGLKPGTTSDINCGSCKSEDEGQVRPLFTIAADIMDHWPKPYFGAVPYIDAMRHLNLSTDRFGSDSGEYIVRYFLSNAKTWRGEDARRIKAELKAML